MKENNSTYLKELLSKGRTKNVINILLSITQHTDFHSDIIQQSAKFKSYKKAQRDGISSFKEQNIEINKINKALLEIIEELECEKILSIQTHNKKQAHVKNYKAYLLILLPIIILILCFSEYPSNIILNLHNTNKTDNVSLKESNTSGNFNVEIVKTETKFRPSLVKIPSGKFLMGSPKGEKYRRGDEVRHWVTITDTFLISSTEVTQKQYKNVMSENPALYRKTVQRNECKSFGISNDYPIFCITCLGFGNNIFRKKHFNFCR